MSVRTARMDDVELRRKLEEQADRIDALAAEVVELRSLVGRGLIEVIRRIQELQTMSARPPVEAATPTSWPPEPVATDDATDAFHPRQEIDPAEYARLVTRIRALVRTVVPAEAIVAVVSRGDDALIDLDGRSGWHFPRCDDGRYAGHHPRDSQAAITHLEELRRRGARYLVFPATGLWWLDHYDELRRHLEDSYRVVVHHDDACLIFHLDRQEIR